MLLGLYSLLVVSICDLCVRVLWVGVACMGIAAVSVVYVRLVVELVVHVVNMCFVAFPFDLS